MQRAHTHKQQVYSKGASTQYLVITYTGKEFEKNTHMCICVCVCVCIVCITESLFCTPETITTLQINYISIFKNGKKVQAVQELRVQRKQSFLQTLTPNFIEFLPEAVSYVSLVFQTSLQRSPMHLPALASVLILLLHK